MSYACIDTTVYHELYYVCLRNAVNVLSVKHWGVMQPDGLLGTWGSPADVAHLHLLST